MDEAGRFALRLSTAGELLRIDQLRPDPPHSAPHQLELFEHTGEGSCPIRQRCWDEKSTRNIGVIQPVNV